MAEFTIFCNSGRCDSDSRAGVDVVGGATHVNIAETDCQVNWSQMGVCSLMPILASFGDVETPREGAVGIDEVSWWYFVSCLGGNQPSVIFLLRLRAVK